MKLRSLISFGLALAAVAVPVAQAGNSGSYIGHPGGPGGAGPVLVLENSGSYIGHSGGPGAAGPAVPAYNSAYLKRELVGGPGAAGPVLSGTSPATGEGFAWADAAVGGGFVAGIALLVAGGALMVRRRREPAHLQT